MLYLDYNATTPVDAHVLETMLPYFRQHFGNAGSKLHAFGWAADEAVQLAREQLAALLHATAEELVFTSGATEALNMAIRGVSEIYATKGKHLITVKTEHKAVLETYEDLAKRGFSITYLDVNTDGVIDLEALSAAITPQTILVSIMWANNETGVVQDIPTIYRICKERGVLFLTDATQALGKIPVSVEHCDLLACSGHKLYAPKGIGALYIRRKNPRVRVSSFITGGGQERGLRGGTLNVPGIVGFGKAAEIAQNILETEMIRMQSIRDIFEGKISEHATISIHGKAACRLPNTSSVCFHGHKAAEILRRHPEIAASTGSACSTANAKPSHVLTAMGVSDADAFATIRFSFGRETTPNEVGYALLRLMKK